MKTIKHNSNIHILCSAVWGGAVEWEIIAEEGGIYVMNGEGNHD